MPTTEIAIIGTPASTAATISSRHHGRVRISADCTITSTSQSRTESRSCRRSLRSSLSRKHSFWISPWSSVFR